MVVGGGELEERIKSREEINRSTKEERGRKEVSEREID